MRVQLALLAAAGLFSYSVPARADFIATASLNGGQETTPGDTSAATGSLTLDYIAATQQLDYTLSFTGLTYPATEAHIHLGPPGVSGAILFPIFEYGDNPTPSVTSETVSGVLNANSFMPDTYDGIGTFAQAVTEIEDGDTYVNVHSDSPMGSTPNYMNGEIRGQITVSADPDPASAPEPASVGLVGAGAAGALLFFGGLRKRQSA